MIDRRRLDRFGEVGDRCHLRALEERAQIGLALQIDARRLVPDVLRPGDAGGEFK